MEIFVQDADELHLLGDECLFILLGVLLEHGKHQIQLRTDI
jgi:hypothetical protein